MRHSIFSVILVGILLGAVFFFMPHLVFGIFILFVIIRLMHVAFMGHRWYGHGYYGHGYHGYDCGNGYHDGCDCEQGYDHKYHHDHHHDHHSGHGHMHDQLFYWADKIRSMNDEEFSEFKNKMDKGFGYGFRGRNFGYDKKRKYGEKNEPSSDTDSNDTKEETTKL